MSNRWASDDDAGSLLAGILDETEGVAREEAAQLEAELQARQEQERLEAEAELATKRAEAEARLSAERERLQQAEARRTQKMEALRIEELKDRGEWVDPAVAEREAAEREAALEAEAARRRKERAEVIADEMAAQRRELEGPVSGKNSRALLAVTGVLLAVVIGAGVFIAVLLGGYEPDAATYSKTLFVPKNAQLAMVEARATPVPVAVEPTVESKTAASARKPSSSGVEAGSAKPKQSDGEAARRAAELQKMLEESDSIFGE